ncbi:hypothetical protein QVD17_22996 [Tagetes erecta]|uniref:Uncharacterized protein n=1 Tax=Tagetes erecta TaxID=13708 RepID=A0AAD8KDJ2_TARER|nr:hypothetical protein QVD17_22996 [Tagetes erecta]
MLYKLLKPAESRILKHIGMLEIYMVWFFQFVALDDSLKLGINLLALLLFAYVKHLCHLNIFWKKIIDLKTNHQTKTSKTTWSG